MSRMQRPPEPACVREPARDELPRHIGIIMDGNGRWAGERHLPRIAGHRAGVRAIRPITETCFEAGVYILTLYAFSTENWSRPRAEVRALMVLFEETMDREVGELHANGVQIRVLGQREALTERLQKKIADAEQLTASNSGAILNVALNYGGRSEIISAIRDSAEAGVDMRTVDESQLGSALYTRGLPDPDLIIRTAGEMRVSNFLLWQAAYAELYVTDVLWPNFGEPELMDALTSFAKRERRFGRVAVGAKE